MFVDDEDVIKSVQRVFEILEWFDGERRPASATQVARAKGYPVSSTNSLLKSMSQRGYLAFDPIAREYLPTLRLSLQSAWLDRNSYGMGRVRELMRQLHEETGETVTLSCQNDLQMTFVEVNDPTHLYASAVEVGGVAPLFRSAIGAVALGRRSNREISSLLERYNRRVYRPQAKIEIGTVLTRARQVRAAGHFAGYGLYEESTGAIAWALPARHPGPPVVVAVAGPKGRVESCEGMIVAKGRAAIARFCAST